MGEAQQRVLVKRGARRSVWVEDDPHTGEKRVLKVFHAPGLLGRALDRRRADRELATLRRLEALGLPVPRPSTVRETEAGIALSLEWIDGAVTLDDCLRGRAPWPAAPARVARALGRLLADCVAHGIVHRDLHAKNLLLDRGGRPWIVDVGALAIRGQGRAQAALEHAVVTLTAELREIAPLAWRLRVLTACARARGERVRRADLARWNHLARERRRSVAERAVERWLRDSSTTAPLERGFEHGLRSRTITEEAAWHALESGESALVSGETEVVLAAWRSMARACEHALPCQAPLALLCEPRARAAFAGRIARPLQLDGAGAPATAPSARRRLARDLGALLGALHDRGLTLVGPLATSIACDASAAFAFTPHARFVPIAAAAEDGVAAARRLAPHATRPERCAFVRGFLEAVELSAAERVDLRRRLCLAAQPPPEALRRRVRAQALTSATRAAAWLPSGVVRGALVGLSPLASLTRHGRTTRANLALALGNERTGAELDAIARGVRRHAARQLAEWLRLANASPPDGAEPGDGRWIEELVELDASVDVLDRELARSPGALVVSAHIGNWELLAARLRRRGHRGAVVGYRRPRDGTARWLAGLRERYGVTNIAQSDSPRTILRALEDGAVVGLLADLEVRRLDGLFVPFFGREALTMTAPAALARAARRPLIPARCVLEAGTGRYRLSFEAPLWLDRSLPARAAKVELLARLNLVFERWIREHPEQWAWHQPRWRTQPGQIEILPLPARRARATLPRGGSLHGLDPRLSGD